MISQMKDKPIWERMPENWKIGAGLLFYWEIGAGLLFCWEIGAGLQ